MSGFISKWNNASFIHPKNLPKLRSCACVSIFSTHIFDDSQQLKPSKIHTISAANPRHKISVGERRKWTCDVFITKCRDSHDKGNSASSRNHRASRSSTPSGMLHLPKCEQLEKLHVPQIGSKGKANQVEIVGSP